MPKPRKSPQQLREEALHKAIASGAISLGLKYDKQIAAAVGICDTTYCDMKKIGFQGLRLDRFARMARELEFTAKDLCAIVGVPYEGQAS